MDGASTLQERIEAASLRIEHRTSDMLAVLEDEMAERDREAPERVRARIEAFGSDDSW